MPQRRIGSAIVDADWDATLSMLAAKSGVDGLSEFFCDTPAQAKRAMDELNEIGDVPFHSRDFAPKWFRHSGDTILISRASGAEAAGAVARIDSAGTRVGGPGIQSP
jgi:hypothetical protein